MNPPPITVRAATADDAPALHRLIVGLAEHHDQRPFVRATADDLRRDGFGPTPSFGAVLAFVGDDAVGYASYTWRYSIWLAARYLDLDDLYVAEAARGRGAGLALMHAVRAVAVSRGLARVRWEVEPDNVDAIRFYQRLGARLRSKGVFTWDV